MNLIDKDIVRAKYKNLREIHKQKPYNDQQFINNIIQTLHANNELRHATIGIYNPIKGEPDLRQLSNIISRIAYPQISIDSIYFVIPDQHNTWQKNKFGILEPTIGQIVIPEILCMPGIAFDLDRNRVGMGGGFYDKYISTHAAQIKLKIGICYDYQILQQGEIINSDAHDQKMDYLISEIRIVSIPK